MNHRKKTSRKTTSSSSSSSCSSENNLWSNNEKTSYTMSQPSSSSGSSIRKPTYPIVPKRTQRSSFIDDYETIQTESRIEILSSKKPSEKSYEYSSIGSSSNQKPSTRQTLDLITKYTSPQKHSQESLLSTESEISIGSKSKRTLSPLNEHNHESKRTKSFDDDDDDIDHELIQLLDHRYNKSNSSQNSNLTISSQQTVDGEQRKPTVRKPTVRKLSTNQTKPIISQTSSTEEPVEDSIRETHDKPIMEVDLSKEDDRENTKLPQMPLTFPNRSMQSEDNSITQPIIPSPIKLPIDNCLDSLNSNSKPNLSSTPTKTPSKQNLNDYFSPSSVHADGLRRYSTTSSNSLVFDTPNSSFSRTTTTINNTNSISRNDCETQIVNPLYNDMMKELIFQMNKNSINSIDYNPTELAQKLFQQSFSLSTHNKYPMVNLLIKKQFLNIGRYEIEVSYPIVNNPKNPTIYVCDTCLKYFHGSSVAYQRHLAKCVYSQPPGKIVFSKDDLAIFQIGETSMNIEQRIYIKSLSHIVQLFIDSNKYIDDTKVDRFVYYILCRRDPILSPSQLPVYHLIGYFSKEINQDSQSLVHNISRLFILPPFIQNNQYHQLLISFSYFLIRPNPSTSLLYCSPARPLDPITLNALRTYWCSIFFTYIINNHYFSIKNLALDSFSRYTSIYPRDILSSLYSNNFIVRHPTDKSSVYLHNNAYQLMVSSNFHSNNNSTNKFRYMDMNLINYNDDKKLMNDKQNDDNVEEIVLD